MRCLLSASFMMAAALMLPVPAAFADTILQFTTSLSAAQENNPADTSPGTGNVLVTLNLTAQTLQINATFSGLTSNVTMAHIHCCAPLGTNANVATTVPAFPGFPLGVTSGTYTSPVFDLTMALIYNPAFVTAQGGLAQAEAALIAGLEGGMTYLTSTL